MLSKPCLVLLTRINYAIMRFTLVSTYTVCIDDIHSPSSTLTIPAMTPFPAPTKHYSNFQDDFLKEMSTYEKEHVKPAFLCPVIPTATASGTNATATNIATTNSTKISMYHHILF